MFVGHYSAALAAAAHPRAPGLGTLFVGAQLVDFGFFGLLLTGAEKMRLTPGITRMNALDLYHMPWTHSLLGGLAWAAAFAVLLRIWLKSWTPALIGGAVVLSHWFIDLLVHRPDLTIAGSPPKLGLGLWNHPAIEMPLEIGLVGAAAWLYARHTDGKVWPLAALLGLLALLQAIDWFGPPPERVDAQLTAMAFLGYGLAALIAWRVGRARRSVLPEGEGDHREAMVEG